VKVEPLQAKLTLLLHLEDTEPAGRNAVRNCFELFIERQQHVFVERRNRMRRSLQSRWMLILTSLWDQ